MATVEDQNMPDAREISRPSTLRSMRLPDNHLPHKIMRLVYAPAGNAIIALAYNAVHKFWNWEKNEQNTTGNASADVKPRLWEEPAIGSLMRNDTVDANLEDTVPCLALSKNGTYVMSGLGGKASLFKRPTFKTMLSLPPAATCLVFHPEDDNIIAIGMSDYSILICDVHLNMAFAKLIGHEKRVTGLAFAIDKDILISSGADAQLCMWNTKTWEKIKSNFLKLPLRRSNNPKDETRVYFNMDQTRFMVVHETQIVVYDPIKLDAVMQWLPQQEVSLITDAVYSCDGQSIFVCMDDGSVSILAADRLRLKRRINYAAYATSEHHRVCPNAIAAHPSDPNQLALGLSDGAVYVIEALSEHQP